MPLNYNNTYQAVRLVDQVNIQMLGFEDRDPVIDSFQVFFDDFYNRFQDLVDCINHERESISAVSDLDIAELCRIADNLINQVDD